MCPSCGDKIDEVGAGKVSCGDWYRTDGSTVAGSPEQQEPIVLNIGYLTHQRQERWVDKERGMERRGMIRIETRLKLKDRG